MLQVNHLIGFSTQANIVLPPPATEYRYALARKSSDQTAASGSITFNDEVYDPAGVHSTVSNTSRFTVPAAWNGRYVRFMANAALNGAMKLTATKNGSSFAGAGRGDATDTSGDDSHRFACAPVVVSTGDYFEATFDTEAGPITIFNQNATWAQLELMPTDFNGAVAQKNTSQSLSAGVTTTLTWETELYDHDTWHDNSANNSRLTVPTGVSLVRVSANLKGGSVTDQFVLSMFKNGASARGLPQCDCDTIAEDAIGGMSAPLAVTPGDYFEARAFSATATSVPNADDVWFAIEELPSDLNYALVHRSSNQAISAGTTTTIQFNAEVADVGGWHDNVTNNSRLTVPAGMERVRVSANLITEASATGQLILSMLKNGSSFIGRAQSETDTSGGDSVNGIAAIVEVTPGDYFELQVFATVSIDIGSNNATWFAIEEVRDTDAAP